ncbi:MAG: biotin--[acetyl-CoA-carboxylase] ligase [Candidatus Latescibacterota bacterium]|nr:MAG: biotin--[acetyl-CoA-carboxylase] ligase [Candidatus Latescibacterota bacterium]
MRLDPPEELLARLVDAPAGVAIVGDDVAQARSTLEARGHLLHHVEADRWRLACAGVHFSPRRYAAARRGRLGHHLEVWECIDSTNLRARQAGAAGAPEGSVWLAEEQSAGRGRQGRTWICPVHAGLLFSLLLRPPRTSQAARQLLPLVAALAVCDALRDTTGADVRLKWPNDLWLEERKLAGVLVEARATQDAFAAVGCGVNCDVAPEVFRAHALRNAISLRQSVQELPAREQILADILAAVERRYAQWLEERTEELVQAWRSLDVLVGRDVRVDAPEGELRARAIGIADSGELLLRTATGATRRVVAGEVHLL